MIALIFTSLLYLICFLVVIELFLDLLIPKLRKRFDKIITEEDLIPRLDREGLNKFFKIGYDEELGWVRKPNTSKEEESFDGLKSYSINSIGSRVNPGYENHKLKIVTFGDSYTFCREVNDNETWQHHLSNLTKTNVANFGVGNYGLDQALLRCKREIKNHKKVEIIIIGVVPETIQRNLTVWKHYSEFGNTFGFKPRFLLEKGKLKLISNPADTKQKFFDLKKIIPIANKYDYFYPYFKKNIFTFPYTLSILKDFKRKSLLLLSVTAAYFLEFFHINWRKLNVLPSEKIKRSISDIMKRRVSYYQDKALIDLTLAILQEFKNTAKKNNIKIIFMMMPQEEDLEYIIKKKDIYYKDFISQVEKIMPCINLAEEFIKLKNPFLVFPQKIYSKNYKVRGGHYNSKGNSLVAEEIYKFLKKNKIN